MSKNKKKIKITKEQYEKLIKSGLIKESIDVNGGVNRVDKTFKKEFAGKNITVAEEEHFSINKPNSDIPKLNSSIGNRKVPVHEVGGDKDLKREMIELIKYLYHQTDNFSPFWKENGLTYDDICNGLLSKKLVVSKNGSYELSKKLGSPQAAMEAVEDELKILIKPDGEIKEMDNNNYPVGSDTSDAPWNQTDSDVKNPLVTKNPQLTVIGINRELAILKGPDGSLYVFYFHHLDVKDFSEFASVVRHFVGKDENGDPQYNYDEDFEIDGDVIENYVNYNLSNMSKGEGVDDFENGNADLIKIDGELKQDLLNLYDKDKSVINALSKLSEDVVGDLFNNVRKAYNEPSRKPNPNETPEQKDNRLKQALDNIKSKEEIRRKERGEVEEMTALGGAGVFQASGHNNFPVAPLSGEPIKKKTPVPVVAEMTSGTGSVGPYDANALPGISRDGSFKESKTTKAEKVPQWAGGSFVKQPNCSKMDNNKDAQNSGCNSGASSLSVVKAKGSINAPSIGEEKIYETISKKTGKSIEEIKRIIQSKNNKPL